jgi:hypothetical protein
MSSGSPDAVKPELDRTITHLLLEHARIRDEASRAAAE